MFLVSFSGWDVPVRPREMLRWDEVRHDPGNNYDKVTGAYTARHDGYYQFSVTMRSIQTDLTDFVFFVDTTEVHMCSDRKYNPGQGIEVATSCTVNLLLRAGQKVLIQNWSASRIRAIDSGYSITALHCWFTGYMIFPLN